MKKLISLVLLVLTCGVVFAQGPVSPITGKVQGYSASGATVTGNPVLVGGSDPSNYAQPLRSPRVTFVTALAPILRQCRK